MLISPITNLFIKQNLLAMLVLLDNRCMNSDERL